MAAIRTQNGSVIVRDGQVSCECCDIDLETNANFGPIGDCDCGEAVCYNPATNPSPLTINAGGIEWNNATPLSDRVTINWFFITGAIYSGDIITSWQNIVSEPSVMRLFGTVGGDVEVQQFLGPGSALEWNGYQIPNEILQIWNATYRVQTIPNEGQFPCGTCATPRNGVHQIDFYFVLWPNTYFGIQPLSFLDCFPYYRLTLRKISSFNPP